MNTTIKSPKEIKLQYEIKTVDCRYILIRYTDGTSEIIENNVASD
ncbi:hypothetical protein RAC89_23110 [Paenibacillus sp. GD4]|nr:hypothetical protein [Paenibacillus sp. GD4]MDQ1913290.1 hypothetical protein [Paenibacillus sp. GD4]